jgi:diguanylate cyclase (GGDEF)-like protein
VFVVSKQKKYESLRKRTLITLGLMVVGLVLVVYLIFNSIIKSSITELEHQDVQENLKRVQNAIVDDLDKMASIAEDWGAWDDTYYFVNDKNERYVENNLQIKTFLNLKLNVMIFTNNSGELVFAKGADLKDESEMPLPDGLIAHLEKSLLLSRLDPDFKIQGIILLPDGPMLITSHPILKSSYEGPVAGNAIMGRFLNDEVVSQLSEKLKLTLFSHRLDKSPPVDFGRITEKMPFLIQPLSNIIIAGYVVMDDIYGQPAIGLNVEIPRKINRVGSKAINYMVYSLIAVGVIFTIVMLFFLGKNFSELIKINKTLRLEIIERKKIQKRAVYLAYHDQLTNLPNRLLFTERLTQTILQLKRRGESIAILFLDLDTFKTINDTMGHDQGDELLKEISKRLLETLRISDSVARIGGDEFIIMIPLLKSEDDLTIIAEKILSIIRQAIKLNNQECFITTSIGVAVYPTDGEDAEALLKNADIAMYSAKEKGKNRCVLCTPLLKDTVLNKVKLTDNLSRALGRNELVLYYQPQVSFSSGSIVGVEALLRWFNPDFGLILPGNFIPIAEQTGLIIPIGEWVLRTACKQNKVWQNAGLTGIRVAVNISVQQLKNYKIVDQIAKILSETGLNPKFLELEITENVAMKKIEYIVDILTVLKKLGVTISIDDFGTEYSSLNYLKHLPIDRIKIAMPFVHGISLHDKDESIINAIITLARNFKINIIAEGVETQKQLSFLTQHKCDEIQGYFYSKPLPVLEMEELMKSKTLISPAYQRGKS